MALLAKKFLATVLLAIVMASGGSIAGQSAGIERIRPEGRLLQAIVTSAVDRSATFRLLVDRIEHSDVIVHVTCGEWSGTLLQGRTVMTSAGPDARWRAACRLFAETQ